jgi:hypothetical protein
MERRRGGWCCCLYLRAARGGEVEKSTEEQANASEPNTRKELLRTGEEGAKGAASIHVTACYSYNQSDTYIEH